MKIKSDQIISKTESTKKEKVKILFFHNTLPEYRIKWFEELSKIAHVDFVFTNEMLNSKIYGFDIDYKQAQKINYKFLHPGLKGYKQLRQILSNIQQYDFVELPPIDSLREVLISAYIVIKCKVHNIKVGYFWEKWEAPRNKQPLARKIKNYFLRVIPKFIYKHSDVIFSVGIKNREYFISNGISEDRIKWIPDVSETPICSNGDLRSKYNIRQDQKIILFLGRMIPQKGVKNLIKAYSRLDSYTQDKCFLLIAGDGPDLNNCKNLASSLNINNIKFAGSIPPSERGLFFSQCNIFVYPVIYYKGRVDVWGLTINEALQHGKIIIATDAVGSAYELIKNGMNGYRIDPDDIEKLKEAISNSLSESMSINAKEINYDLRKVYNYSNMAETYLRIVKEIIKTNYAF